MEIIKSNKNSYNSLMNQISSNYSSNNNNNNNNNNITENDLNENTYQTQTLNQEEESQKLSYLKEVITNQDTEELGYLLEISKYTQKSLNIALLTAVNLVRSFDKIQIVHALLSNGANVNIENPKCKRSILMIASSNGDIDLVNTLVDFKASINTKDKNNQNCLFHSLNSKKGDNADVVLALLNAGADVNLVNTKEESPLIIACRENLKISARILVENGANVNVIDKITGNNALHYAAEFGNLELTKLLITKSINFKLLNKEGQSALNIALKKGHSHVFNFINEECKKKSNIDKRNIDELFKESKETVKKKPGKNSNNSKNKHNNNSNFANNASVNSSSYNNIIKINKNKSKVVVNMGAVAGVDNTNKIKNISNVNNVNTTCTTLNTTKKDSNNEKLNTLEIEVVESTTINSRPTTNSGDKDKNINCLEEINDNEDMDMQNKEVYLNEHIVSTNKL